MDGNRQIYPLLLVLRLRRVMRHGPGFSNNCEKSLDTGKILCLYLIGIRRLRSVVWECFLRLCTEYPCSIWV
ncbi:hypothetical protein LIER_29607 [Lithospermum erythrorhizon]|uniref:Uncharacterized protein n=1 Tax=Lithospermum erythrorhizon TaxID=34254 RepID=A0AAV3RQM8_LITER